MQSLKPRSPRWFYENACAHTGYMVPATDSIDEPTTHEGSTS